MTSIYKSDDQTKLEIEGPEISDPQMEEKVERQSEDVPTKGASPFDESGQMLEEAPKPNEISRINDWRGFGRGRCQRFGCIRGHYGWGKGIGFRHRARMGFGLREDFPAAIPEFAKEQRIEFLKERVNLMKNAIQEFTRQIEVTRRSDSDE